ncbi:MAG: hypothetical protein ACPL88_00270 [Bryobacteraceae bacterium]
MLYRQGSFSPDQARGWEQGLAAFFKIEIEGRKADWRALSVEDVVGAMLDGGLGQPRSHALGGVGRRPGPAAALGQLLASEGAVGGVVLKQSGGDTACPPSPCGCDTPGATSSCGCTLLRDKKMGDFCMCYLCYEKVVLSDLRQMGSRALIIVMASGADQVQSLIRAAQSELAQISAAPAGVAVRVSGVR